MAEFLGDNSKHRSCWRHLVASLHGVQRKVRRQDMREIQQKFEQTSPCFSDIVPCRQQRSKRSGRRLRRQRWKMDDFTFDDHLEKIWTNLSEDKRSEFAQVGSICFSLYRREKNKGLNLLRKEDIFSKKFVFVPIVCWDHWRLVVFCHFGETAQSETRTRCILLLDSVEMGAQYIEPYIRTFVYDIFKAEGRPEIKDVIYRIPFLVPKVPQQKNDVDCGRYVLYFIKQFIDAAPENFSISNGYPCFIERGLFDSEKFEEFCDKLNNESPAQTRGRGVSRRSSQRITKRRVITRKSLKQDAEVVLLD